LWPIKKIAPIMRKIGLIFIVGFLISCNSNSPDNKDCKVIKNKSVIIAKGIKNIEDTLFSVPKGLLIGKWRESIDWVTVDSTWTGTKSLKIIHEYEFFPNGKFLQRQINLEDSSVMWTDWGEGYFNNKRTIIYLNHNSRNDTIFKIGEHMKQERKRIHLANDSILRIDEHFWVLSDKDKEIVEYKRIK
jgi:hypothetical protein